MTNVQTELEDFPELGYEDQKRMARDGSHEQRCELAARDDVRPEILYYLAGDPDPGVRRYIARNESTPRHADLLLAQDEDDRVRSDVAGKIAASPLGQSGEEQSNVYRVTMQALEVLAGDQLVRVRQILSEALKDSTGAPRHVIEKLALDRELTVSGPVLEHSPLLTDEFLIGVLNSEPVQGALKAISRRVALGQEVADAIVDSGDAEAVAELLGNESAQIREETLDRIVDQAPGQPGWHGPLVHRPGLHLNASRRLAEIVAGPLLAELKKRTDLDDASLSAIDEVIQRRLDGDALEDIADLWSIRRADPDKPGSPEDPSWASENPKAVDKGEDTGPLEPDWAGREEDTGPEDAKQVKRARKLLAKGALKEKHIVEALNDGQTGFVVVAVSSLAGVSEEVIRKAASLQNAKAIVALAWKAGLSMRLATRLQMNLAKIPPSGILRATASDGYPISPEEMTWQLEFIAGMTDGE
ncbi:MAG: DUF2336 domain-containing protein [Alphaproteobacteria bacterium]|nr:DUF2336 domain-containing protein [Alphaproteobacteria bacterium]